MRGGGSGAPCSHIQSLTREPPFGLLITLSWQNQSNATTAEFTGVTPAVGVAGAMPHGVLFSLFGLLLQERGLVVVLVLFVRSLFVWSCLDDHHGA